MVFEQIERLKREYTDKYVVVDASRPEYRRFEGLSGVVRTVNMNGRALVEFGVHNNIGWIDIPVDYLKVVDKPVVPDEAKGRHGAAESKPTKAAPAAKPDTAKPAAMKPAAAPAAAGGMDIAAILAAARAGKSGDAAAQGSQPAAAKPAAVKPVSEKPAAERPAAAKPGAMSVADILAAARGQKPAEVAAAAVPAAPAKVETAPEPEPETPAAPAKPIPARSAPANSAAGPLPTTTADIVAWCRQRDAK